MALINVSIRIYKDYIKIDDKALVRAYLLRKNY